MSFIIGLTSLRPSEADLVYLQTAELNVHTLMSLERSMRGVVQLNRFSEWPEIQKALEKDGFSPVVPAQGEAIFVHARPWDEHLTHVDHLQSFFVTFPSDAPYEIANRLFLASRNASLYSMVAEGYLGGGKVIIITNDHDLIYPEDDAWIDDTHTATKHIGRVELIREQFCGETEYAEALAVLTASGYEVPVVEPNCEAVC